MAYRLSWIMTTKYPSGKLITEVWAGDYPEDIPTVLKAMKEFQDAHNEVVKFGAEKCHPPFIRFAPIVKVHNQFVDKQ